MLGHLIVGGHEFIGECPHEIDEDTKVIHLKKAVKCLYQNNSSGLMMMMKNLHDDNNYVGNVDIFVSGTIIFMPLQEMGELRKTYSRAISKISLPNSGIVLPEHQQPSQKMN